MKNILVIITCSFKICRLTNAVTKQGHQTTKLTIHSYRLYGFYVFAPPFTVLYLIRTLVATR